MTNPTPEPEQSELASLRARLAEVEAERDAALQRAEKAGQERGVVIADHTKAADCTSTIVAQDAAGMVSYAAMAERLKQAEAKIGKAAAVICEFLDSAIDTTDRNGYVQIAGDDWIDAREQANSFLAELEVALSPARAAEYGE